MTAKRCQIGNAVPPSVSKLIFEGVRKTLRRADGLKVEE
jgi:site-specific DNA-cytosine methylase